MHELWLCKSILEIVNQKMIDQPNKKIKKIYLEMGMLTAIEKSIFIFNFNMITQGTFAENVKLQIIEIPGEAICDACKTKVAIKQYGDACPECANFALTIIKGEELLVKSMEVE